MKKTKPPNKCGRCGCKLPVGNHFCTDCQTKMSDIKIFRAEEAGRKDKTVATNQRFDVWLVEAPRHLSKRISRQEEETIREKLAKMYKKAIAAGLPEEWLLKGKRIRPVFVSEDAPSSQKRNRRKSQPRKKEKKHAKKHPDNSKGCFFQLITVRMLEITKS